MIDNKDKVIFESTKSNYGFTLVELIVTLLIVAIVVAIAAPFIITQLADMEAKRIRYSVSNTLNLAKAESLVLRKNLIVCLSDDGGVCDRNGNKLLLLFIDNNENNNFDVGVDQILEEQYLNPKYATLHLRAGGRHHVKFFGDTGLPRGHFGHIKYCPSSTYNTSKYQISFNQNGIVKYKPNSDHPTDCD